MNILFEYGRVTGLVRLIKRAIRSYTSLTWGDFGKREPLQTTEAGTYNGSVKMVEACLLWLKFQSSWLITLFSYFFCTHSSPFRVYVNVGMQFDIKLLSVNDAKKQRSINRMTFKENEGHCLPLMLHFY